MIKGKFQGYFWFLFCIVLAFGFTGCKNQQKLAAEQAAQVKAENTAKAKEILNAILNDDGQLTLAEKERMLRQAKALGSDDPEVLALIAEVEDMIRREREAQQEPQDARVKPEPTVEQELQALFGDIAGSANSSAANRLINEGLGMFSSPETPVLIIISLSGDLKDYDQPTTIERYLNYLKDQRISPNGIYQVKKDDNGKISELELIKKSQR